MECVGHLVYAVCRQCWSLKGLWRQGKKTLYLLSTSASICSVHIRSEEEMNTVLPSCASQGADGELSQETAPSQKGEGLYCGLSPWRVPSTVWSTQLLLLSHFTDGKTEGGTVKLAHCGTEMSWRLFTLQPTWIVQCRIVTFLGRMVCTWKGNAGTLAELFLQITPQMWSSAFGSGHWRILDCWSRLFLRCIWYVIIIT